MFERKVSGSAILIPLPDSLGIGGNLLRAFPHDVPIGKFGELVAVVQEVAQVPIETSGIAQVHAYDPLAGPIGIIRSFGRPPVVQSMGKWRTQ